MINQGYINHVVFVLDRSGSMQSLEKEVIKVFDSQVEFLAERSKQADQETRVSVYLFDDIIDCIVYDKDVLRLPSIKDHYKARNQTDLIGGTLKAIEDLKKTPELYGDHAFLIYVLTDGAHNVGTSQLGKLLQEIKGLPDNWTLATLVPNQQGVFSAKQFGFPAQNIQVWATDTAGIREVGETIKATTSAYMTARSAGVKGTKNLFQLNAANLNTFVVKNNLTELDPKSYTLLNVRQKVEVIKDLVEAWKLPFRQGSNYYELTKRETIQPNKQICAQHKITGKVYSGLAGRQILGLPDVEVKVDPVTHGEYKIFVQSNSNNRKLMPNTQLLVMV